MSSGSEEDVGEAGSERVSVSESESSEEAGFVHSGESDGSVDEDVDDLGYGQDEGDMRDELEAMTPDEVATLVMVLLKPVSVTMAVLVFLVKLIEVPDIGLSPGQVLLYQGSSDSADESQQITGGLLTGGIVLVSVLVATSFFILLYKYRCMKLIYTWLICASGMLLGMFGGVGVYLACDTFQFPLDWFTLAFLVWNFGVCGVISIFWYAPLKLQQAYLVAVSVLMAAALTQLPEWTTFIILGVISVYDIFAVLCPKGPLKVLIDAAEQNDEVIPALLYSTALWFITMARASPRQSLGNAVELETVDVSDVDDGSHDSDLDDDELTSDSTALMANERADGLTAAGLPAPELRTGMQLGLGDFVFYSFLVGRAALYDWTTVFATFIAVVFGLLATLVLLSVFNRALPALPISIFLGILFYFSTNAAVIPLAEELVSLGAAV
mmetsp:Transcript_89/g.252  ORF Transcript_89/g.252 Transcript_89/m.252 type:complete len:440 (-) Transcript_89:21-1340(-)